MVKMKIKFQGKFLKEEVQVLFSFSQRWKGVEKKTEFVS